jgi:Organic solute transporter Ostalpha
MPHCRLTSPDGAPTCTYITHDCRECYEAYVIYCFLQFLVNESELGDAAVLDGGGGNGGRASAHTFARHRVPFCCLQPWGVGPQFLHKCKQGVLQYVVRASYRRRRKRRACHHVCTTIACSS